MSKSGIDDNTAGTASIVNVITPTIFAGGTGLGDVFENADTADKCAPNSIVKYVNIRLQTAIRDVAPEAPSFQEYALVVFEELQGAPTVDAIIVAGLGTQTLGDLCVNLYRGNCIWNGAYAVSREVPGVLDLKIRIPDKFCKQKRGMYLSLLKAVHTADVTDTTTDVRTFFSFQFKTYV